MTGFWQWPHVGFGLKFGAFLWKTLKTLSFLLALCEPFWVMGNSHSRTGSALASRTYEGRTCATHREGHLQINPPRRTLPNSFQLLTDWRNTRSILCSFSTSLRNTAMRFTGSNYIVTPFLPSIYTCFKDAATETWTREIIYSRSHKEPGSKAKTKTPAWSIHTLLISQHAFLYNTSVLAFKALLTHLLSIFLLPSDFRKAVIYPQNDQHS